VHKSKDQVVTTVSDMFATHALAGPCQAGPTSHQSCCSKIAEAEAVVSVNEKKWLVMHVHVQMRLDELRGPQPLAHCDMKVSGQLLPFCWAGCCIRAPL
jgi:hypothetical protein